MDETKINNTSYEGKIYVNYYDNLIKEEDILNVVIPVTVKVIE